MVSKRVGNVIAAFGLILLSVPELILFLWAATLLDKSDVAGGILFFLIPFGVTFALVPVLRLIGADYALAAGTSTAALFALTRLLLNTFISAFDDVAATAYHRSLQLLGPLAGFLAIILLFRLYRKVSEKAIFLIPAGALTVLLVDLAAQKIIDLGFRYLS